MEKLNTRTTDTFITADGKTARYQDIFDGIAANVRVYGFNDGKGMSREDLEDIFQDAAYKAIRSKGSYDTTRSAPRTYGSRIAGNCEKDAFRKAARRASLFTSLEEENDEGDVIVPTEVATAFGGGGFEADREVESREALSYIERKIAGLDENYRFILRLHLRGLKPKKMAEVIGCTPVQRQPFSAGPARPSRRSWAEGSSRSTDSAPDTLQPGRRPAQAGRRSLVFYGMPSPSGQGPGGQGDAQNWPPPPAVLGTGRRRGPTKQL